MEPEYLKLRTLANGSNVNGLAASAAASLLVAVGDMAGSICDGSAAKSDSGGEKE